MDDGGGRISRRARGVGVAIGGHDRGYTADHGLAVGQQGLLGKQNIYEHSVSVPLLAARPGITAVGAATRRLIPRDLFPTCARLAGVPPPDISCQTASLPLRAEEAPGTPPSHENCRRSIAIISADEK